MTHGKHRGSRALMGLAALGWTATLHPTTVWASDPVKVLIKDFMYEPMSLTVKASTTVTWVNRDDEPHTVISDAGLFRSGGMDTDETFSFKFDKPGTYRIVCSIHPTHGRSDRRRVTIMNGAKQIGLGAAATIAALAVGAALFIASGAYDIGADDHHTKLVLAIIEELRERSISARADAIDVPPLADPARIAAGATRYSALCVGCHLAPGVAQSDLRPGLYPHPPNLAQEDTRDPRRAFWTIKHGIKMSAMPAWGKSLSDAAIWDMVAFVRQMPAMSPATYQELSSSHSK